MTNVYFNLNQMQHPCRRTMVGWTGTPSADREMTVKRNRRTEECPVDSQGVSAPREFAEQTQNSSKPRRPSENREKIEPRECGLTHDHHGTISYAQPIHTPTQPWRESGARVAKYVAMIFAVLVMCMANIGMAWGDTTWDMKDVPTSSPKKLSGLTYWASGVDSDYPDKTNDAKTFPAGGTYYVNTGGSSSFQKDGSGNWKSSHPNRVFSFTVAANDSIIVYWRGNSSGARHLYVSYNASTTNRDASTAFASSGYSSGTENVRLAGKAPSAGTVYVWVDGSIRIYKIQVKSAAASGKNIYLKPNGIWDKDGARFAAYYFKSSGSGDGWVDFASYNACTPCFKATIPSGYDKTILCRMDGSKATNDWDNRWNQTENLTVPTGNDTLWTITSINECTDGKSCGSWGTYTPPTYTISYSANGGTGTTTSNTGIACGGSATLTANGFTYAGYSFNCWHADVATTVGGAATAAGADIAGGSSLTNITSDITMTAQWTQEKPTSVAISGGWRYFPGQTVGLKAKPTGGTGSFTYQWQKKKNSTWTDLANGTDATDGGTFSGVTTDSLQISGCTAANSGEYRCVVSKAGGSTASDEYDVHIYTLNGNYNGSDWTSNDITLSSGTTGTVALTLEAGRLYKFKIKDNYTNAYFGNAGYMLKSESSWACPNNVSNDIRVFTGGEGTYTFTVDIDHTNYGTPEVVVSVTYPSVTHPAEGYVYFTNPSSWSNVVAYWWKEGDPDVEFAAWASSPWMFSTTICENTYYYMPKLEGYDRVIFYDSANGSNKTGDIEVAAANSRQKHDGSSWGDFSTYTITFAENGGTGTMSDINGICPNASKALTANAFTKTGYTFSCWHADVDVTVGESTITAGGDIADEATLKSINDNITLTAQWTANTYTVTLNVNGGTINAGDVDEYTYGVGATLPTNVTKTGYTFGGWYDNSGLTGDAVTEIGDDETGNKEYWAKWTAKTTTITINANTANHGSTSPGTVTATYGSALPSFTAASGVSGYDLAGYYTDATSGTKIINDDGTLVRNTDYATDESTPVWKYETGTLTLYAQYEKTPCPTSGSVYSLTFVNSSKVTMSDGDNLELTSSYATITGGVASIKYFKSGNTDKEVLTSGNLISYGTNDMYLKLELDCPLLVDDTIRFADGTGVELAIATDDGQPMGATHKETTSSYSYVVTSTDNLVGESVLYIGRSSATTTKHGAITIKRRTQVAPTFTSPAADQAQVEYTVGDAITALSVTVATSTFPAAEYQWYRNATKSTEGASSISGATEASYTPSNAETSDYYYYCVAFNSKGSATSHYFRVTVNPAQTYDATYDKNGHGTAPDNETEVTDVTLPQMDAVSGWKHTAWTADKAVKISGESVTAGTELEIGAKAYLTANTTFTAVWTETYAVEKGTYTNGSITISPTEDIEGGTISLTATPNDDYLFTAWTIKKKSDGTDVTSSVSLSGQTASATFTMPAYAVTVDATFTATDYCSTFTVSTSESGNLAADDVVVGTGAAEITVAGVGRAESMAYTNRGLQFSASGDSVDVSLPNLIAEGSVIRLEFYWGAASTDKNRGLTLKSTSGTKIQAMTWKPAAAESKKLYYIVKSTDTELIGTNKFRLVREENTVYLASVSLGECGSDVLYGVTYNANGGSCETASETQASFGASVTLPTPTWSGYTFEGWYNAGTKIGNGGASYTPTADITLYAHWTDNISGKLFSYVDGHYGDKCKGFEGSWISSDQSGKDKTLTNGTTGISLTIDDGGWDNKSATASIVAPMIKFLGTSTTTMNCTIPEGKHATITILYGSYDKTNKYLKLGGSALTKPSSNMSDPVTSTSGFATVTLTDKSGVVNGFTTNSGNVYIAKVSATITGYTVSYAAGTYGSGSLDSGTKTAGSSFTLSSSSSAFTRDGFIYDGWSVNADGSTKDYNLGDSYTTDDVITLYPHWAEITTFNGDVSGEWNNTDNWSGGELPTINNAVVIEDKNIIVNVGDAQAATVILSGTSTLTVQANKALVVDGKITKNGTAPTASDLLLESTSDGNATLIFDNSNSAAATVQMYSIGSTDGWKWQYIGVPFEGANAQATYYGAYLYKWNNGWTAVQKSDDLEMFAGYCISYPAANYTYVMDGTLAPTTSKSVSVAENTSMVVGNSWTAPIQITQFEDEDFSGLLKNVYLYNTGNDAAGEASTTSSPTGDAIYAAGTYISVPIHSAEYTGVKVISSLQGFFVKDDHNTAGGGTLSLNYSKHVRPAGGNSVVNGAMHAPKRVADETDRPAVLKMKVSGSQYDDRLILLEREDFTTGYDAGWDGDKMGDVATSPRITTTREDGTADAVAALPDLEGTLINFRAASTDDQYTLYFDYETEDAEPLYLLDLTNNAYTRVETGGSYTFFTTDKADHKRFALTRYRAPQITTGVEDTLEDNGQGKAVKFIENDKLYILRNGVLYDGTGKKVIEN